MEREANVEVLDFDKSQNIEVLVQEEVQLDINVPLFYIKSGEEDIKSYVNNHAKPEITAYTQEAAKKGVDTVNAATANGVTVVENKAQEEAANIAREAIEQVEQYKDSTVIPVLQEFVGEAQTQATSAMASANKSQIWAEGEQSEVQALGGTLSSMGAADFAMAIANTPEDVPLDQSKLLAMNIVKGAKGDKGDKGDDGKDGGGLEIGDVAFAVMGVDETKNLRRYLNGQVISQTQFVSFTNWVKERAKLFPNIVATEENWQAEVTNSPYGICGKFVIDDTLGTIRLPKYPDWSIREIGQASVIGNGMTLGLTNGASNAGLGVSGSSLINDVSIYGNNTATSGSRTDNGFAGGSIVGITTDPTKSGVIADFVNANTEDKLQGKWFIQVATGVEESVDVTREIELNNPFSLLDYKWSEYELNNASWLISNGAFHSGTVYKAVYELLLKIKNGAVTKDGASVKLSTEDYTDTDFVLNTSNTTFRLPIKVKLASGNAVVGNGITLGLTNGDISSGATARAYPNLTQNSLGYSTNAYGEEVGGSYTVSDYTQGQGIGVTTDPTKSGIETSSSGLYLYFYVGETIQDANVINASGVLTRVADLSERVAELSDSYISGLGMPDFSSRITIPYSTSIQLPCDAVVYHSDYSDTYSAYCYTNVSLDGTSWFSIGHWGWSCMGSSYTVLPKGIYVKCFGKSSTNHIAWYAPLKGVN